MHSSRPRSSTAPGGLAAIGGVAEGFGTRLARPAAWWWPLAGEGDVGGWQPGYAGAGKRGLDAGGDDGGAVVLVVGGVRAGSQQDGEAVPQRAAAGLLDAVVALQAGDNDPVDTAGGQCRCQAGIGDEDVRLGLPDGQFPGHRGKHQFPALGLWLVG